MYKGYEHWILKLVSVDFARSDVVSPQMIKPVCKEILDALGLDYIDSFQVQKTSKILWEIINEHNSMFWLFNFSLKCGGIHKEVSEINGFVTAK